MPHKNHLRIARHKKAIRCALMALLALAMVGTLFFAMRIVTSAERWQHPPQSNEPIAGWMTPRYVSRAWHVPPEIIGEALALEKDGSGRKVTLDEIAAERGIDIDTLIAELAAAIDTFAEKTGD